MNWVRTAAGDPRPSMPLSHVFSRFLQKKGDINEFRGKSVMTNIFYQLKGGTGEHFNC